MNLLQARLDGDHAVFGTLPVPLTLAQRGQLTSDAITVGVRPTELRVSDGDGLEVTIDVIEELGAEAFLYCTTRGIDDQVVARVDGLSGLQAGTSVTLTSNLAAVHLFDTATGARLTG